MASAGRCRHEAREGRGQRTHKDHQLSPTSHWFLWQHTNVRSRDTNEHSRGLVWLWFLFLIASRTIELVHCCPFLSRCWKLLGTCLFCCFCKSSGNRADRLDLRAQRTVMLRQHLASWDARHPTVFISSPAWIDESMYSWLRALHYSAFFAQHFFLSWLQVAMQLTVMSRDK